MKVLVRKSNNLVVAILQDEDGVGMFSKLINTSFYLFPEDDNTDVAIGYTCVDNGNGTRSYIGGSQQEMKTSLWSKVKSFFIKK